MKTKTAPSKAVSSLDDTLSWLADQIHHTPKQPDEFTVKDAVTLACGELSDTAMRNKLLRMKGEGLLTSRQIPIKGSMTTLYKRVVGK